MSAIIRRGQEASTLPVPAPVGGLNAVSMLAAMPATDAEVMDNVFAQGDRIRTRAGYTLLATAATLGDQTLGASEEGFRALMKYSGETDQFFGLLLYYEKVAGSLNRKIRLYQFTGAGSLTNSLTLPAAGTSEEIGGVSPGVQFTSGAGTSYLIFTYTYLNAAITPAVGVKAFDGTAWSSPSITGLSTLFSSRRPCVHQRRLWFVTGLKSVGYLPPGAISGTLSSFDISQQMTKGGVILDIQNWTVDGGDGGIDDKLVFLTSTGQAIVYEGTDPGALATWRLVGVFDLAAPVSVRSVVATSPTFRGDTNSMRYTGDILLALRDGLTSMNRILRPAATPAARDYSISAKIRPLLATAATTFNASGANVASATEWKLTAMDPLRQLFVSIPTARVTVSSSPTTVYRWTTTNYVMNTETGAWQKFSGINILDSATNATGMYFIDGSMNIYAYDDTATSDNGTAITFEARQAYNYFQNPQNKSCTLVQLVVSATGNFSGRITVDADFNGVPITTYENFTIPSTAYLQPQASGNMHGRCFAVHVKGQTSTGVVSWYATNWFFDPAVGF